MEEVDDAESGGGAGGGAGSGQGRVWRRVCGCRTRSGRGRRMQELRGYATTTAQLLEMAAWLRQWHVQRVVMESTSDLLEGRVLPVGGRGV